MKFNYPINNFSSGEWSPRMLGRTDTEQYGRACEELTNMIPQMTGGIAYRGGFANFEIQTATTRTHLNSIAQMGDPFVAFKLVSYRPYDQAVRTTLCISNNKWFTLPVGVEVTYSAQMLAQLAGWFPQGTQFTQLGDLIVLVNINGSHKPKVFFYDKTAAVYKLQDIDQEYVTKQPWKTIPWGPIEALDSNVTLNPAATTGSMNVTASAAFFSANMVGSYLRFSNGTALDGVARIIGYSSPTQVTVTVLQTIPTAAFAYGSAANTTSFWQQSAWSNAIGWPRTVTSHQGRLVFGGSPEKPDTIWGSRISNYFDFQEVPAPNTTGPLGFAGAAYAADNSRPFTLTPNSQEASNIVAMSSSKTLTIHTIKSEIIAYGSNGALGPVNVVFESSTSFGAAPIQPVRINNYLTFVQATGRKIRDLVFNFEENQYKSTDLAFVADHLFLEQGIIGGVDKIYELAKTESNSSILWIRTVTGKLYSLTLDRDYQITAWSRIPLGKSPQHVGPSYPYAHVVAICSHPSSTDKDALQALVLRKINGVVTVSFEIMTNTWELANPNSFIATFDPLIRPTYMDCVIKMKKTVGTTWVADMVNADSPHRNTTVSVVADGNYIGEFTVANDAPGTLTLLANYTEVFAGYKYKGRVVTMPLEQGGQTGTPMGRQKRINELVIRFFNTAGALYGKPGSALNEIPFRDSSTPLNSPIVYFSGDKVVDFPPGYERRAQVVIEQNNPYPMHIVAVIPQGTTYD